MIKGVTLLMNTARLFSLDSMYETKKNKILEDAYRLSEPDEVEAYYFKINDLGVTSLVCPNFIQKIKELLDVEIDKAVILIDFDGIEEISAQFAEDYIEFIITEKHKILSINKNISVQNQLNYSIINYFIYEETLNI